MSKLKVENLRMVNKGAYLCSCDVEIIPWCLILKDVRIFRKGESRWLKMPSHSWKDGEETKFKQLVWFTDPDKMAAFTEGVCDQAFKLMETMPAPEVSAFEAEEELPF